MSGLAQSKLLVKLGMFFTVLSPGLRLPAPLLSLPLPCLPLPCWCALRWFFLYRAKQQEALGAVICRQRLLLYLFLIIVFVFQFGRHCHCTGDDAAPGRGNWGFRRGGAAYGRFG